MFLVLLCCLILYFNLLLLRKSVVSTVLVGFMFLLFCVCMLRLFDDGFNDNILFCLFLLVRA